MKHELDIKHETEGVRIEILYALMKRKKSTLHSFSFILLFNFIFFFKEELIAFDLEKRKKEQVYFVL